MDVAEFDIRPFLKHPQQTREQRQWQLSCLTQIDDVVPRIHRHHTGVPADSNTLGTPIFTMAEAEHLGSFSAELSMATTSQQCHDIYEQGDFASIRMSLMANEWTLDRAARLGRDGAQCTTT
jgi:hypothetical protein